VGENIACEPGPSGPDTHPTVFWFFFWGGFAELCSYYGTPAQKEGER
jgi:hypothetical protein